MYEVNSVVVIQTSAVVAASSCVLKGVIMDGQDADGTILIYDNASAGSGKLVLSLSVHAHASGGAENTFAAMNLNIGMSKGIYATITGTSPYVTIIWG